MAKKQLARQAIEQKILRETFEEFSERVIKTLQEFPHGEIDRTIESMNGRVKTILKNGGVGTQSIDLLLFLLIFVVYE